jgi:thioredoxin reductase
VLVLGGGPGGYSAAFRAADLGLKVVMVCWRRLNFDHLCRLNLDQGLLLD